MTEKLKLSVVLRIICALTYVLRYDLHSPTLILADVSRKYCPSLQRQYCRVAKDRILVSVRHTL
jgi:hypothetical protein